MEETSERISLNSLKKQNDIKFSNPSLLIQQLPDEDEPLEDLVKSIIELNLGENVVEENNINLKDLTNDIIRTSSTSIIVPPDDKNDNGTKKFKRASTTVSESSPLFDSYLVKNRNRSSDSDDTTTNGGHRLKLQKANSCVYKLPHHHTHRTHSASTTSYEFSRLPLQHQHTASEIIEDIKAKIPEHYIISIKEKAESIDAQTEIILFTEDLRSDNA